MRATEDRDFRRWFKACLFVVLAFVGIALAAKIGGLRATSEFATVVATMALWCAIVAGAVHMVIVFVREIADGHD